MNETLAVNRPSVLEQCGLDTTRFRSATLDLAETPPALIIVLQSLTGNSMSGHLPFAVPESPGRFETIHAASRENSGFSVDILAIQPDQWWIVADSPRAIEIVDSLRSLESGNLAVTSTLSDAFARIRIGGNGARWLLCKLGSVDFHSSDLRPGFCTRIRLGNVAAIVQLRANRENRQLFDVFVDRSLARYLWELLIASAPHADELTHDYGEVQ